jgi:hypothetical protein
MTETKSEHLTLEMISAVLEEPELHPDAEAHLAVCEMCGPEHSRMRRMLMALSGLGEIEPPEGEWERIEAELPRERQVIPFQRLGVFAAWPVQAAAAVLVFAGGIAAGLALTGGSDGAATSAAAGDALPYVGDPVAVGPRTASPFASGQYYDAVAALEGLRVRPVSSGSLMENPAAAASRLARLDALILASREELARSPADPAINNLLFELVEERDALADGFEGTVRLAGLEYR